MNDAAAEALAAGFAEQVAAWARRHGASEATQRLAAQAAAAVSLATSQGHVCLPLRELAAQVAAGPAPAAWREALATSGVVGTPGAEAACPLILDGEDRLYLHRYFDLEQRLARRLLRAAAAAPGQGCEVRPADVDPQQLAVALALRGRLTLISGGPGTGKTSTVVNLLARLLAQDPGCRVVLAAPTGKAAARMTESVRARAAHLPEALRARLPTEASTVHRLLGVTPVAGRFRHHAGRPLDLDVLVVDEASMLDLALATRLLEAVPDGARIVLLGDKDQLCAVESGAVFAELSAASPLRDAVVEFTRNYRFSKTSGIGRLAADIQANRVAEALTWLQAGTDDSVSWLQEGADPGLLRCIAEGYAPYLQAVRHDPSDAAALFQAFERFRVLCAVREGPRGQHALGERMSRHAREALAVRQPPRSDPRSPWYAGRPVMVLRNDYVLRLFNGDIGITVPDEQGELVVVFPDPAGGFRRVAPVRMPEHQTAFAMTVHKSQGSEFREVLVVLPQQAPHPVLTRELLYTAVTRARERVTLACSAGVLAAAIGSPTRRRSGLVARLGEEAGWHGDQPAIDVIN